MNDEPPPSAAASRAPRMARAPLRRGRAQALERVLAARPRLVGGRSSASSRCLLASQRAATPTRAWPPGRPRRATSARPTTCDVPDDMRDRGAPRRGRAHRRRLSLRRPVRPVADDSLRSARDAWRAAVRRAGLAPPKDAAAASGAAERQLPVGWLARRHARARRSRTSRCSLREKRDHGARHARRSAKRRCTTFALGRRPRGRRARAARQRGSTSLETLAAAPPARGARRAAGVVRRREPHRRPGGDAPARREQAAARRAARAGPRPEGDGARAARADGDPGDRGAARGRRGALVAARAASRASLGLLVLTALLAFFLYRYATLPPAELQARPAPARAARATILLSMLLLAQAVLWIAEQVDRRASSARSTTRSAYVYLVPIGGGRDPRDAPGQRAHRDGVLGLRGDPLRRAERLGPVRSRSGRCSSSGRGSTRSPPTASAPRCCGPGSSSGARAPLVALAVEAIARTREPLAHSALRRGAGASSGGAVGVGLLVSFALPLLEGLFGVLTDIRLLELSNVSNPLLSQLARARRRAPTTTASSSGRSPRRRRKAIGANSLFCRVAAFYHDIGKIRKPEYYIENQRGVNPHDRLAPSMSALIISAHVKDGIRMAREARLPEQIVDIIPQHHGTRLMTYFYEKAKTAGRPRDARSTTTISAIPGPKPQTQRGGDLHAGRRGRGRGAHRSRSRRRRACAR